MGAMDFSDQLQARARAARKKLRPRKSEQNSPVLVQEDAGIRVGISADLPEAAQHAARIFNDKYQAWHLSGRYSAWGQYKRQHFAVAVGGGNTVKAQYQAMVTLLHDDVDWIDHVRFFFLEESSGETRWESPEQSLVVNFLAPLAQRLIKERGLRALCTKLQLESPADEHDVIERMVGRMVNPINMAAVKQALNAKNRPLALKRARNEALRYERDIQNKLGETMQFHYIISGIGKKGALGAFSPYMSELCIKSPRALVLKQGTKALRVALNRGVLTNGECISLIVSGNLKLRALGRFAMEESADFEQTVMETPLRMLRETHEVSERVYIFADEQALHFEETAFKYTHRGNIQVNKAETRKGEEKDGPHILLLHGFMGLFSFASFLVRLPSAWTVSALHRGSHAKTLGKDDIFPHYAQVLRQAILKLWASGRAVPVAGHSIAGVISDHLLLSLLPNYDAPITPYAELKTQNQKLVNALRSGGIIHLATWAPADGLHTGKNIKSLISHYRTHSELDYSGFERVYQTVNGTLQTTEDATVSDHDSLSKLSHFLDTRLAKPMVSSVNILMRSLLNNKTVQQRMLNTKSPYVLRLVGNRLLKTASFYGLCKEIDAAMHDPIEYQRRHLRALDIIIAYDIPFLSIVHEDDFLVSARRHQEENAYLVAKRKQKEGVTRETELQTTTRFIKLQRAQKELPLDPLNPHLMIIATSSEANDMARQITAAITRFVNENIARAARKGQLKSSASVRKWLRENQPKRKSRIAKVA